MRRYTAHYINILCYYCFVQKQVRYTYVRGYTSVNTDIVERIKKYAHNIISILMWIII